MPAAFGIAIIASWQAYVHASGIPIVLLPSPSRNWAKLSASIPTLAADFVQTFVRAVIPGWLIGCGSGFLVAVAL